MKNIEELVSKSIDQPSKKEPKKFLVCVESAYITNEDFLTQVTEALDEYGIVAEVYELTENDIQMGGEE